MYVVHMPLNAEGQGPETDSSKIVKNTWEVWDDDFETVSSHDTEEEAWEARRKILQASARECK